MNVHNLSVALENINDKYILETIQYVPRTGRRKLLRYSALAACACLLVCAVLLSTQGPATISPNVTVLPTSSSPTLDTLTPPGEKPPLLYINDTLYKGYRTYSMDQANDTWTSWIYLGEIKESVARNITPSENFQINMDLIGVPIYQDGDAIIVVESDQYTVYYPLKGNK